MAGVLIDFVSPGSVADELELDTGDRLLKVNGQAIRDLIDFSYYTAYQAGLLLEIEKQNGEKWELEVELAEGESFGLTFAAPDPARCANNCLFCFVHQLPKGLRKALYVKDEDYRLSFLNGNYVTLANLSSPALQRVTEQRLSPLYVSVHATNPNLREQLLGKTGIPPIIEQLQKLAEAGINMHTQVVLCPGLNDGEELKRTVADIAAFFPVVQSLAIVPVGLTAHRQKLPVLTPVDAEYARQFIVHWQPETEALRRKLRKPFLFLADEFFLKAELPFPAIKEYGGFPQIENGVGMVPLFIKEAAEVLRRARQVGEYQAAVVTGVASFPFVSDFLVKLGGKCGLKLVPFAVENHLFGTSVTVSGLVSGKDIIAALQGHEIGAALFVPDVMVKDGEDIFLDDLSLAKLERQLGCRVILFDSTPRGFYKALKFLL